MPAARQHQIRAQEEVIIYGGFQIHNRSALALAACVLAACELPYAFLQTIVVGLGLSHVLTGFLSSCLDFLEFFPQFDYALQSFSILDLRPEVLHLFFLAFLSRLFIRLFAHKKVYYI